MKLITNISILILANIIIFSIANAQVTINSAARGWDHGEFGRLVFDLSPDTQYNAISTGNILNISFTKQSVNDIESVINNLSKYISGGIILKNGRKVNFTLRDDIAFRHFKNNNSVVIDLHKKNNQENNQNNQRLKNAEEIKIRIGEHPNYLRMVFDWTSPVEYSVSTKGDKSLIWFNKIAKVNISDLKNKLPNNIAIIKYEVINNGIELSFKIAAGIRTRHFLSGNNVVVDFLTDNIEDKPVINKPASLSPPQINNNNDNDNNSSNYPTLILPIMDEENIESAPVIDVSVDSDILGPAPVSLSFQWPKEVGAASFRRGNNIWIIFDHRIVIDLAPLISQGKPVIKSIEQLPISGATVLRLKTKNGINPTVRREGFDWVFDFRKQRLSPTTQATINVTIDNDLGPQILFPTNEPGNIIHIFDPEIGDTLRVATYKDAGVGVKDIRVYPEFQILPSAQGVIIEILSDNLLFDRNFNGFHLSSPEGLHISSVSPEESILSNNNFSSKLMFDFKKWYHPELPNFIEAKHVLSSAVVEVPPEKLNSARIDLARFYLSRAMGADANGVLSVIEAADKNIAVRADFKALRGAAHYLNGDYEEAKNKFFAPRLDGFGESAIWRGAILAKLGDWKTAAEYFTKGDNILRDYPQPLKGRIGIVRLEAALTTRDLRVADSWINELENNQDEMRRGERGDIKFHKARIAMSRNDLDVAKKIWQDLTTSRDTYNAVRSEYALINLGIKQDEITFKEAIKRLTKLRYRWRGDRFELAVLRRQAELYIDNNDYFNGLAAMRTAVTYFPNDILAEKMAEKMTNIFSDLYLNKTADKLPPLRALAIYDEFRELTPSGPDGDDMLEKLADRLIGVDLLNRADALLLHQVKFRLQGEEKARVGAKLALIRLFNKDPNGAIKALDNTNFPQIDFDLENDRRRVRAKAYFEIGDIAMAIKLLTGDITDEADMLRRDIFWHDENWTEVSKVLQRLAGEPPKDPEVGFVDERARYILNWAVALLLNEDDEGLQSLRGLFSAAMVNTSLADSFDYITTPIIGGISASLENTIQQLSNSEQFDLFLNNYRKKFIKS